MIFRTIALCALLIPSVLCAKFVEVNHTPTEKGVPIHIGPMYRGKGPVRTPGHGLPPKIVSMRPANCQRCWWQHPPSSEPVLVCMCDEHSVAIAAHVLGEAGPE